MYLLAYRGRSLISKAIRWQTRSVYSHVALEDLNGTVYEAWHVGGVRKLGSLQHGHAPGTKIDRFAIIPVLDDMAVRSFLLEQLGKKYDYRSVFRFLTRRECAADDRWFCSELVAYALNLGGVQLQSRIPSSKLSPRDVCMSPVLVLVGKDVVGP